MFILLRKMKLFCNVFPFYEMFPDKVQLNFGSKNFVVQIRILKMKTFVDEILSLSVVFSKTLVEANLRMTSILLLVK